jgi:hypothetical protein
MRVAEAIGAPKTWARWFGWATAAGVAFGVAGPFGSYFSGAAVARIAYWTGLFWTGTVVLGITVGPAIRLSGGGSFPLPFVAGAATLAGCVPLALAVATFSRAVWGAEVARLTALDWYAQVLFVSSPLVAGVLWFETRGRVRPQSAQPAAEPERPAASNHELLSAERREQVICLQMEDHYVRVHTAARSELLLLPMHQAISLLSDLDGRRVHRSWWVARKAVKRVHHEGRAVQLVLTSGMRVPVSRNRVAELRTAGWLGG